MLKIKQVDTVKQKVQIRYPEDGSVLDGFLTCEFRPRTKAEFEALQDKVNDGEITDQEYLKELVPVIGGMPSESGGEMTSEQAHEYLDKGRFGMHIKNAIVTEYFAQIGEARAKNSKRSRVR